MGPCLKAKASAAIRKHPNKIGPHPSSGMATRVTASTIVLSRDNRCLPNLSATGPAAIPPTSDAAPATTKIVLTLVVDKLKLLASQVPIYNKNPVKPADTKNADAIAA